MVNGLETACLRWVLVLPEDSYLWSYSCCWGGEVTHPSQKKPPFNKEQDFSVLACAARSYEYVCAASQWGIEDSKSSRQILFLLQSFFCEDPLLVECPKNVLFQQLSERSLSLSLSHFSSLLLSQRWEIWYKAQLIRLSCSFHIKFCTQQYWSCMI